MDDWTQKTSLKWSLIRFKWRNARLQPPLPAWGLHSVGLLPGGNQRKLLTRTWMCTFTRGFSPSSPLRARSRTSPQLPASSWVPTPPASLSPTPPVPPPGILPWMSWTCWERRCCSSRYPLRGCRSNGTKQSAAKNTEKISVCPRRDFVLSFGGVR